MGLPAPSNSRTAAVFIVPLATLSVAFFFVALRLLSKWIGRKQGKRWFTLDDGLVIVALALACGCSAAATLSGRYGLGLQDSDIPLSWKVPLFRSLYAFTVLYFPALTVTKCAILVLYLRMFVAQRPMRIATYGLLAVVIVSGVVLTLLNLFRCSPIIAAWVSRYPGRKCINLFDLMLCSAPVNFLTDLAIIFMPLPFLTHMTIELKAKVLILVTFCAGIFVAAVDLVRIYWLQQAVLAQTVTKQDGAPPQLLYKASLSLMWSTVEVNVGIIWAALLVLKPLISKVIPNLRDGASRNGSMSSAGGAGSSALHRDRRPSLAPTIRFEPVSGVVESPTREKVPPWMHDSYDPLPHLDSVYATPAVRIATPPPIHRDSTAHEDVPCLQDSAPTLSLPFMQRRRSSAGDPSVFSGSVATSGFGEHTPRKPMTELTNREAWSPVLTVSLVFLIWGISYGLVSQLNGQFQTILEFTPGQVIAIDAMYWAAYACGPPFVGYWSLTRLGFKYTFVVGLLIYAVGACAFSPSASLASFPGFMVSNFISALGISCLEIAANPYIALVGPPHLMEARLNFAQGIQATGTVLSGVISRQIVLTKTNNQNLLTFQWVYIALCVLSVALALAFHYLPIPEGTGDDFEAVADRHLATRKALGDPIISRSAIRWMLVASGVFTMFLYVSAQQGVAWYFSGLFAEFGSNSTLKSSGDALAVSHALFALGRFVASGVCYVGLTPRGVLMRTLVACTIWLIVVVAVKPGLVALSFLILFFFWEGPIFPTLFAMSIRNQGRRTFLVSSMLTMSISGGAVAPSIMHGIITLKPSTDQYALVVVAASFGACSISPIVYLASPMLRSWLNPLRPQSGFRLKWPIDRQLARFFP